MGSSATSTAGRSRSDVRELGAGLQELEIQFEDQPEYRALDRQVHRLFSELLREALPNASRARLEFSTQLLITTLESVGKSVARRSLSPRQIARWADECAAMLCKHLELC
jgi:hypothetical protein